MDWTWVLLALPGAILLGLVLRAWREPRHSGRQAVTGEGPRLPASSTTVGADAAIGTVAWNSSRGARDGGEGGGWSDGGDGGGDGGGGGD